MRWHVFNPLGRLVYGAILFLFSWGACLADAQAGADQDLTSLSLEELMRVKVVTASRHEEDSRAAPSTVTVITREEIVRYGWRTLADVLNSVRSFYTRYDRNYAYLGARGFQEPGDYNTRILVLIDGHRVNENVYDRVFMDTDFPLSLDLIDHIEIVRGPSSSLFGTDAVYGVINVITRRPSRTAVEVSGDTSSFLGRSGRLTTTYQGGKLTALLSGSLYRSAGAPRLYFPEFAAPATNNGYAQDVDGDGSAQTFADIANGNTRVQGLHFSRTKLVPTAPYGSNFNDSANRTTDTRSYVEAGYHRSLSVTSELDSRVYYDAYRFDGTYGFGGTTSPSRFVGVADAVADWAGIEATLGHKTGRQRITLGTTYERDFRVDQRVHEIGKPPVLDDRRTSWLVGAYGETELILLPKFTIRAGGRLDWFDTFGGAFSPRAAAIYSPTSRTSLKYIFSRAFRAPSAYESHYHDNYLFVSPVHHLNPEHIHSNEVALERTLFQWLQLTADAFYNNINNIVEPQLDPASGLLRFGNGGTDCGRGLEFELEAKSASGFAGRLSYTLADAKDGLTGVNLGNSPMHTAKLNAMIPVSRKGFLGAEMLYSSAQTSFQQTRVSPSFLTNLTFSTKQLWGGWEFSASCYNAFDRRWFTPGGPELRQAEIQQDGRTYRFKVTYRLGRERRK